MGPVRLPSREEADNRLILVALPLSAMEDGRCEAQGTNCCHRGRSHSTRGAQLGSLALLVPPPLLVLLPIDRVQYAGLSRVQTPTDRNLVRAVARREVPHGCPKGGSPWGELRSDAQKEEGPVHEITLSPFLIGKYEVSQAEWKSVMGSLPADFNGNDNLPVAGVSWEDIQRFNAKTGLSLPTEAQWEYACRAGTSTPFAGDIDILGWHSSNSEATSHPAGKKAPNGFGLYDMHGNMAEWCRDLFDPSFYSKPEAKGTDPVCTSGRWDEPVIRGGNWIADPVFCRSAYRRNLSVGASGDSVGFRPASPIH